MDYDCLSPEYWQSQVQRVEELRNKINKRGNPLTSGTVVPEEDDLALGEGRRLKMAVMFLDISGFSSRSIETEEEQRMMLSALNLFFTEMLKIAEDYGGTVEKNTGDGLMAYFEDGGTLLSSGDGCKRAVACALTMLAANQIISTILNNSKFIPFNFRISIDYGMVTVARLGAAKRFNAYVAIGTVANLASKILKKVAPGGVILGENAKRALPLDWQNRFTQLLQDSSGWFYKQSGLPYNLYIYNGRWIQP